MRITVRPVGVVPSGKSRIRTMCARASATGRNDLDDFLRSRLKVAQAKMAGIQRSKTSSNFAAGISSRGIQPVDLPSRTRNDVVGLVGEMLCEDLLPHLNIGEPFHVKWREGGSSLTNGVDMIFKKDNHLYATESKHLHRSISGSSTSAAHTISSVINKSLVANTDSHTNAYLATLLEQEFVHGAACDARGDKNGRKNSDKRYSFLCSVIRHENYSLGVAVTFDDVHNPQAADIDNSLSDASPEQFAKSVLAFAIGVDWLYDTTEDMIRGFAT